MLFLECEILLFGTANKNGGNNSASNDANVFPGVSYSSWWTDASTARDEDAVEEDGSCPAIEGSAGR